MGGKDRMQMEKRDFKSWGIFVVCAGAAVALIGFGRTAWGLLVLLLVAAFSCAQWYIQRSAKKEDVRARLYEALFSITGVVTWEWNLCTGGFRANWAWRALGHPTVPKSMTIERYFEIFYPFSDEEQKRESFRQFLRGSKSYYRTKCAMRSGDGILHVNKTVYLLRNARGTPEFLIGSLTRSEQPQPVRSYDRLTLLPQRDSLLSVVKDELAQSDRRFSQSALLLVDMNHFSQVNSMFGYTNGDDILRQIGQRMAMLSYGNVMVGRGESNNFVLFISDIEHVDEVEQLAQRVFSAFREPFSAGDAQVQISVAIGAFQFYPGDCDLDTALHSTFVALERAKEQGRSSNRYVLFNQSMLMDARQRKQILFALENFRENGCLSLHYQPQFYSEDNRLHAFEALLRLEVDGLGTVPPAKFIPLAEESEVIEEIGYWVIEEACRAIQRFRAAGMDFETIAVNVSLVQLITPGFVERVKEIIEKTDVSPSMLEIEITESVLMSSVEHGADILRCLHEYGINIVLDDFGSGYSSLNYIRALSIDTLKIDKVFVDGICSDDKSKYIVEMVLNLARQLGLEVVAEGVETVEQLKVLQELGCPVIQGYYYSRPLPEQMILERYSANCMVI